MIAKSFDVIVVGAGSAGSIAARFCAEFGLNVCLIDCKPKNMVGDKVCGDAVGTDIFNFLKIEHPKGEEVTKEVKGFIAFAPDLKNSLVANDRRQTAYMLDRLKFGQRLLKEALNAGVAQFLDNTLALDLLYDEDNVVGVKVRSNKERIDLKSKIVIDASGIHSTLRRKIKSKIIEKKLADNDAVLCYREIIEINPKTETIFEPDYVTIIKDPIKTPGGLIWYFPKSDTTINIGLGTYIDYCKKNKGVFKENYRKYVLNHFIKSSDYKVLASGGGVDPLRRVMWSCADNGIMFAGDAAFHVNPINGGGIDPSMRAGFFAAKTAKTAIDKGDFSINGLWGYNQLIMSDFGAWYAALDLQRVFFDNLPNEDSNFLIKKQLITGAEYADILIDGTVKIPLLKMISKAIKGRAHLGILLRFNTLRKNLNKMIKHCKNFPPSVEGLEAWKLKSIKIIKNVREKFAHS